MPLNLSSEEINSIFPVIGITVFPGGIVIRRQNLNQKLARLHKIERGKITVVSKRSLNKLALTVRSCGVNFSSVMTLSYGLNYPHSGRVAKRHLNAFLVGAKREFGPFDYFWVLEFQKRGAVHFHIATTLPEPDYLQRSAFAHIWTRIAFPDWSYSELLKDSTKPFYAGETVNARQLGYLVHVHVKAWEKVRSDDGMSRYLAKYANKLRQKEVPDWYSDVGRFWGASRKVKLPEGDNYHGSETEARQVLELRGRDVKSWRVLPKIVLA
jgi:hypothetical protein